jgi:purine-binding chemotaxis protein CheW
MAEADVSEDSTGENHLVFSIHGNSYAFPSDIIGEIAAFDKVYGLPLMPAYIPGVINRYSVPYALLDTGLLFYNIPGKRGKVIILKDDIDRIAFLVDEISDIADIREHDLFAMETDAGTEVIKDFVTASVNTGGKDVYILDIQKIIKRVTEDTVLPEVDYD